MKCRDLSRQGGPPTRPTSSTSGISAEDRGRLFTKFFRSSDAAIRDAGGTGLGLVIVKGIVERHGGRIDVESEKGIGSRFILLP